MSRPPCRFGPPRITVSVQQRIVRVSIPDRARERISRPHDARVTRSREALKTALLELIDTKPLDLITIKEITAQAKVSYPVFFRQFASKEDLLADVATEQVRHLLRHSQPAFERKATSSLDDLCRYVNDHRKLWSTLLTAGANEKMRAEFSRIANEIAESRPRANPALPADLVTELVTNAIFDILRWWLRQDEDNPVGNVVKLLDTLVVRAFTRPIAIHLD
jgi:AcrR family transcriptional regulator